MIVLRIIRTICSIAAAALGLWLFFRFAAQPLYLAWQTGGNLPAVLGTAAEISIGRIIEFLQEFVSAFSAGA